LREEAMAEIQQRLAQLMPGGTANILLTKADRELQTQAVRYAQFALPTEVANQLNDLFNEDFIGSMGLLGKATRPILNIWKRFMLNLPWRSLRYGINNFMGDFEGVVAGCPGAVRNPEQWKKVWKDLVAYYKGEEISAEMQAMIEAGGISGGYTAAELGKTFGDTPAFRQYLKDIEGLGDKEWTASDIRRLGRKMWGMFMAGEKVNEFRESLLRYKTYLYALEQLKAGKEFGSLELPWAASRRETFEGLTPEMRVAKWSRELLIDYGAISALGRSLRENIIPFYSWFEGNPRRYKRLVENAVLDLKQHWGEDNWRAAAPATRLAASFLLMTAGVALFNMLMFWDDEDAKMGMAEYAKERGYLVVIPPGEKHDVYYVRVAAASRDLLEWAGGIEENVHVWKQFANGQLGLGEAILHVPKSAVNKVVGSMGPLKTGVEIALGRQAFPDVFKPRPIRKRDEALADLFGFGGIYEWGKDFFTPVPSRGGIDPWLSMLSLKHNDPGLGAYNNIRGLRSQFEEQVLNRTWEGGTKTRKSELAYLLRLAHRFGDEKAEERIREELAGMGISQSKIGDMLKGGDPQGGLTKKQRKAFEDWLTPDQRELLDMAQRYYQETFR
jgi:hypothetical protein